MMSIHAEVHLPFLIIGNQDPGEFPAIRRPRTQDATRGSVRNTRSSTLVAGAAPAIELSISDMHRAREVLWSPNFFDA